MPLDLDRIDAAYKEFQNSAKAANTAQAAADAANAALAAAQADAAKQIADLTAIVNASVAKAQGAADASGTQADSAQKQLKAVIRYFEDLLEQVPNPVDPGEPAPVSPPAPSPEPTPTTASN